MTIQSVGQFRRVSKDLESACVNFMEDLRGVWDDPGEVSKTMIEARETLGAIYGTLEVLEKGITRIEELQVMDKRKHLRLVKGSGKGAG
jgi:hypothetical protein